MSSLLIIFSKGGASIIGSNFCSVLIFILVFSMTVSAYAAKSKSEINSEKAKSEAALKEAQSEVNEAEEDVEALVEKLIANIPFRLVRHVFSETTLFKGNQAPALELIEKNTNVPIAGLFARIRQKHGVEFILSDEELAFVFARYFRGLFVELTLDASQTARRLEQGKRLIVSVLTSFIRVQKGARR